MRILVTGAGISGLSAGRLLKEKHEIEIIEQKDKAGGLIKCDRINGNLFHRVGGHVFNSKNTVVLDWFWKHFDKKQEFIPTRRNAKIWFKEKYIGYPIENYLYQLPDSITREIVRELLELVKEPIKEPNEYNNFKEFLLGNFGNHLYNLYFGPYNAKIWNANLEKIPLDWLEGKLPMPNISNTIMSNILREEESNMVHATFFYPKKNGSQFIVDRFSEGLPIHYNYKFESLKYADNKLLINNEKRVDSLIYSGDVRKLHEIIQINDNALIESLKQVINLKSNGTSNVLCETDPSDISWLYLPESETLAHRIIYTGNFSETNNSTQINRKTCVVEFSGSHTEATIIEEIKKLPGNLKPLAFNFEPNSYIINEHNTRDRVSKLKKELQRFNIFLLGRFAEWEYYNMDKCIEAAMELEAHLNSL